jgi:serine/threonine protein kinase
MISHLGRYEIIDELGHGAMGIVYKAKDPLIDRVLAIKTISLNLAMDEKDEYEARFYQEAKAAGRLSHPNIVTVYDVGRSGDVAYIAMEFLQGRELRDILDEGERLPVGQVLDIVMQVALGLAYAHEHGIVHRDVKPSNIMVIRDGHVKITDFGIARMASSTVQTQTGVVLGSPKYMSPEQVLGKSIDQRSDIFSLGVMLYEMLTGRPPFVGDTINAVMYQTMNTAPPPPSTLNPEVPAMLNFIITKALAKGLDDRYQNTKEFADDLRACRDALPRAGTPTPNAQIPDAIPMSTRIEADDGESKPLANMGLSSNFDSFEATMRLAAMTAPEDVEELGKTLRMTRPTLDAIHQAAPVPAKPKVAASAATTRTIPLQVNQGKNADTQQPADNRNLLLLMIALLVLLGVVFLL